MRLIIGDPNEACLLDRSVFLDKRGAFEKLLDPMSLELASSCGQIEDCFVSVSRQGVLRGMHFQRQPFAHAKIVTVLSGSVQDVVLDLRSDSKTFGQCREFRMCSKDMKSLFIPEGFAHGFLSLEDETCVHYLTTKAHVPDADDGIRWNSFGFEWKVSDPILSERDSNHPCFSKDRKYFD